MTTANILYMMERSRKDVFEARNKERCAARNIATTSFATFDTTYANVKPSWLMTSSIPRRQRKTT